MDDRRPERRRKLTPAEEDALRKQRKKQRELEMKKARKDAKYREQVRRQRRDSGEDPHIIIEIPARPEKPTPKPIKRRAKTTPDIIKAETNKRVRNMDPKDYDDGYYIDEVKVRKDQAKKQKQKRKNKQRKPLTPKQRKIRRVLGYTAVCVSIIVIGVVLSLTVLFKTEEIVVQGNELYDSSTIVELSGVDKGENIFVATMFGNTDDIVDKLPYVKDAKISFQIPNKIIIKITHDEPYYALKCKDEVYLINENGRILEKVDKVPKKMMTVTADNLKEAEVGGYVSYKKGNITKAVEEIARSFKKHGYSGITAINVKKVSNISFTYDDRILIRLGMPDDIDYKIRTAFTIINEKLDPDNEGKIQGVLNVSECHKTKKSYFNEGDIHEEEPTIPIITVPNTGETESVRSTFVTIPEETDPEGSGIATDSTQGTTEPVE